MKTSWFYFIVFVLILLLITSLFTECGAAKLADPTASWRLKDTFSIVEVGVRNPVGM